MNATKLGRNVAMLAMLLGVAFSTRADDWAPSHHCSKPVKPFRFTSEYEVESFKSEVEEYERCIDDFVRHQEEAAQAHKEAAKKAVNEWNSFVRFELR